MLEKEYLDIDYLRERGFVRKRCVKCGKHFWTLDESREICGDPPCESYGFIGNPVFKKKFTLDEMREHYLSFFEKRGHTRVDRYPVVARWRDDIYLTIASIADFQPFVTSGVAPPPANPLTISQPCIRMDDLDSVGKTGRHLTLFEMMAHHAFNSKEEEIYWKSETVQYCTELLEELGVRPESIVYKEEPWAGGGNAGPCLEAIVSGIELATLVFMNLVADENGTIEIKGEKYRKMDRYIVDTGYGLERFVWASQGTPTVYDAIFPSVLDAIEENSSVELSRKDEDVSEIVAESSRLAGVMGSLKGKALEEFRIKTAEKLGIDVEKLLKVVTPLEKIYALADHTRAILFMLGDGLVPSNAGGGYLARLMIRRAIRLAEELELTLSLFDLVEMHRKLMKNFSFDVSMDTVQEILELEEKRYRSTIEKGIRMVERIVSRKKKLDVDDLVELYDSHGVPAEIAVKIAKERGINVELPENFYSRLAERHSKAEKKAEVKRLKGKYPKTEKLYYEPVFEFEAEVIGVEHSGDNTAYVILDKTAFYPESGGQCADTGYMLLNGRKYEVSDVFIEDGVIAHVVRFRDGTAIKAGDTVKGVVNRERRLRHTRHHSATHLLLYSARKVLGNHVWQAGAKKEFNRARLDITHYRRPDEEQIREIELVANREVMANKPVRCEWMDRIEAEKKYGFRLYQGGVPPGREIRVVRVGDDVQACAGTHCSATGEIGVIKVLRVESIQDGVIRFEFAAGEAALEQIAEKEKLLREASSILRVEERLLPKTVKRFFEEWKEQKKTIDRLAEEIAVLKAEKIARKAKKGFVVEILDSCEGMQKVALKLAEMGLAGILLCRDGEKVRFVTFSGRDLDAGKLARKVAELTNGGGGGKKDLAQGAGRTMPNLESLWSLVEEAEKGS